MSDFKPGDKVLVRATVSSHLDDDNEHCLTTDGGFKFYVPAADLESAPYVDPELVPGMVVAPLDKTDPATWHVVTRGSGLIFGTPSGHPYHRESLPDEIRVVFDPLKVSP